MESAFLNGFNAELEKMAAYKPSLGLIAKSTERKGIAESFRKARGAKNPLGEILARGGRKAYQGALTAPKGKRLEAGAKGFISGGSKAITRRIPEGAEAQMGAGMREKFQKMKAAARS